MQCVLWVLHSSCLFIYAGAICSSGVALSYFMCNFECCTVSLINAGATSSTGVVLLVNLCNYQCSMWGECKVMIIVSALIIAHCLFSDEFK